MISQHPPREPPGPLPLRTALYLCTRRLTTSDVTTVVNTILPTTTPLSSSSLIPLPLVREKRQCEREELSEVELRQLLRLEQSKFEAQLEAQRKKRMEAEKKAAKVLQRVVRGFLLRRWLRTNKRKIRLKAKVQQSYAVINRQIRLKLELQEQAKMGEEKQERASVAIQCAARGFMARRAKSQLRRVRRMHQLNKAQTRIAAAVRARLSRRCLAMLKLGSSHQLVLKATVRIQTSYRAWLVRAGKRHRMLVLHHVAATMIQQKFRRSQAVAAVKEERRRSEDLRKNTSAITLQKLFRAGLAKRRIASAQQVAEALERDAAALCIARVVRGWFARRIVAFRKHMLGHERRLAGALHMQRVLRGFLGRCRAEERKEDAETDVFFQTRKGDKQMVEDLFVGLGLANDLVDAQGNTVLLVACKYGHAKIARKCLKWGMDINHLNDKGESAVALAVLNGHAQLAESLIAKKAYVEKTGKCLLHDAARKGFLQVVQALLHREVDPHAVDPTTGQNALHAAISADVREVPKAKIVEMVDFLLSCKVPLNAPDKRKNTPLHLAARKGNFEGVKQLSQAGADLSKLNDEGFTAWKVATAHGYSDCAQFLRTEWTKRTQQS